MIQAASRSQFNQRQSDRKVRHTGKAALILLSRNCTEHVSQHKVSPKIVWGPWNLWQYGFLILRHSTSLGFSSEIVLADPQGTQGLSVNCHTGRKKKQKRVTWITSSSAFVTTVVICLVVSNSWFFSILIPISAKILREIVGLKPPISDELIQKAQNSSLDSEAFSLWTQGLQPQFSANL